MDDAVASVLAERARLDRGLAGGIAASIVIHGAITAAAIFAALRHAQTPITPAINIRFAPMPAMSAPAVQAPAPAVRQKPAAVPAPKPPVLAEPIPPPTTTATSVKPSKGAPPSPFGRSTKKPADVAAPPAVALPSAGTAAPAIDIPVGGSGVTGLEGGDFPYTVYIDRMRTIIGTHWFRPQGGSGTTTVYFMIDRDGTLHDARTETTSGNGTFDRAALRAILESSPLPPLPFGYNGTFLGVHLTFR